MSAREEVVVRGMFVLVLVGALILYFAWPSIVRMTADAATDDVALWLYDSDVAPGDRVEGRVRVDGGDRIAVRAVRVLGAGEDQRQRVGGATWGDKITERKYDSATASAELAFVIPPETPEGLLLVTIEVDYVTAVGLGSTFFNDDETATFERAITIHSPTARLLRRVGKGVLAVASWAGIVALLVAGRRRYARRGREPSAAWSLLVVPYALLGPLWFAPLLGHALRLHGWWFVLACSAVWIIALVVVLRRLRTFGMRRYVIAQTLIPTDAAEAYRGAPVQPPICAYADLEMAWLARGLFAERDGDDVRLVKRGVGEARMYAPPLHAFGGEPFEVFTHQREVAIEIVEGAAKVLGELRAVSDGEPEIRSTPPQP